MRLTSWTIVVERLLVDLGQGPWPWAIMKNHEHLPAVVGDVDLCLAREHWDAFTRAIETSLGPMGPFRLIWCDHFIGVRLIFIVPASGPVPGRRALEVDLADGVWWKGTLLCPADRVIGDFVSHLEGEPGPHTSAGFQAALRLTVSAIRRDGRLDRDEVEEKQIVVKARSEPAIFLRAMDALHGPAGVRAAQAILGGRWTASAGRDLIVGRIRRSSFAYRRAICFLQRKTQGHWRGLPRYVPDSAAHWLALVSRGHELV
jgi:hypothetical protein